MLLSIQNFESNPEVAKLAIHNQSAPNFPDPCFKITTSPLAPGEPPDHRAERQPGAAHRCRGWRPGYPGDGEGQPPVRRLRPLHDLVLLHHHQPRPHLPQVTQDKSQFMKKLLLVEPWRPTQMTISMSLPVPWSR